MVIEAKTSPEDTPQGTLYLQFIKPENFDNS